MTEIKFKAWHRSLAKMFPPLTLDEIIMDKPLRADTALNLIYLQYTGLKDIKGVGIYRGDIVRDHAETNSRTVCEIVDGFHPHIVDVWGECTGYILKSVKKETSNMTGEKIYFLQILNSVVAKKLEVIGNIYENPKLLPEGR